MPADHPVDDLLGVHVRHVQGDGVGLVGVGGDQIVQGLWTPGGGDHDVAAIERRGRDGAAEPAAGAGDQPDSLVAGVPTSHRFRVAAMSVTHTPAPPGCANAPSQHWLVGNSPGAPETSAPRWEDVSGDHHRR